MIYENEYLNEIAFPIGGIGTGSISIAGNGHLVDWEIFNRPNKGSLNGYSGIAVRAEYPDGSSDTRVLQGDWTRDLMGQYRKAKFSGYGFGPDAGTYAGFPHFEKVKFDGRFPIAELVFSDKSFPGEVTMIAFNPFIPLDSEDSSIPAAFFDIKIRSLVNDVKFTVAFAVENPFDGGKNTNKSTEKYCAVTMESGERDENSIKFGDLTLTTGPTGAVQTYWYRGGWQDAVSTFWRELCGGELPCREYPSPREHGKKDTATVWATQYAQKDEIAKFRFILSWSIPNNTNDWDTQLYKDEKGNTVNWKNYYAMRFENSLESAVYSFENFETLYEKTARFRDALYSMTLDESVIIAAASSLAVLKSPTVWRLSDGSFYGWEGVHEKSGSCEGTCTHVWSYAYALCFLFPDLERSIRENEFKYDIYENGTMRFRLKLPVSRPKPESGLPCVDGQMATVIKCYRDWKLTGDTEWLRANWDTICNILEYAWSDKNFYEWDADRDGVLEGRQHHTLDMELFGPSAWLQGIYLAALKAAARMADCLGDTARADEYRKIFKKGYDWTKNNLFNGEYYIQKVDLSDKSKVVHFGCEQYWNDEKGELKYQIADGCEIDQLLGQWHSNICGLGNIFDKADRLTALKNMYKYNFKPSLRNMCNMWRVFALNDEGGAIICEYPEGHRKPVIPIPYCEECMTGFEYAFAGLLISEGFIDEGLDIVRAVRSRYDGKKRNPFNEIECGSNYARAMASFALIPIFSGFEFDMPNKYIGFSPKTSGDFRSVWSVGTGWGTFDRRNNTVEIQVLGGYIELCKLGLKNVVRLTADGNELGIIASSDAVQFDTVKIESSLVAEM